MEFMCGWLIIMIASLQYSYIEGRTFFVSTYGAYPNDNIDDTNAIQLTIDMAIKHGSNNVVTFGSGTYTVSSAIGIVEAVNLTITGQGMHQTLLLGTAPTSIFEPYSSQQLLITSLSIDFDPLPFTAGYVINATDTYLDLQVQPPHKPDVGRQVQAILRYDVASMRPAFGPNTYELYQKPPNINTSLVTPGIVRIPLASRSEFIIGDAIVARYVFRNHAVYAQDVTDLTIQSVTTYTSWCMSFYALRARRFNVIDYHVLRKDERWMSTIVDCIHFSDAREYINIIDSQCESMGDDGLNVHAAYLPVTQVINSSALVIQSLNSPEKLNFGIGTHLEFTTHAQPFTAHATGAIATSSVVSSDSRLFTFTSSINATVGDWAIVADTPVVTIRNFTVANNRARGVLLESRNIHVTRSLFNATSGPAVYFQPSMFWHEGPTARNVTLDENLYINCNEGIAKNKGVVLFLSDPIQLVPIVSDVRITSSTFLMGTYSEGILQIDNGANVSLSGNYIATNNSIPLISLCNSRNISASNNTVVNTQSKIDQYYTYDTTVPCNVNLSSLIDLPPSAFNSSFPPPVMKSNIVKLNDHQEGRNIFNDENKLKMARGRGRGSSRGAGRGRGRGASRGRGRGASRGRGGRGRIGTRGGYRGGHRFAPQQSVDGNQQTSSVNPLADLDINADPKPFFVNSNVTIDQHIQAQTTNLPRYLATLFTLDENSVEILQKAKACALAAAWCRHDHKLANNLLRHRRLFTLTEVLKAVTMLDAGRRIRVFEKHLKRLELSKTKPKATKLGKIKNNIDNLNKLKPSTGSASGAVARHIQRWTRTLTQQELEYFALHMPTEPWKKLADIVHLNPTKDFPSLPWFLPFCFGTPAPTETMVSRCRDLTSENVNNLIKEFKIPYSHLKQFKDNLNDESKARIASYEEKLDTILWYYEDLQCSDVDDIISERLKNGEQITLPYGKLMERLLLLRTLRENGSETTSYRGFSRGRGRIARNSNDQHATRSNDATFYSDLLLIAEAQLEKIKLPLESPVAVIGDASSSMNVAIRTATILSSLLTAICSAKLNFFHTEMFLPTFTPKSIEDVLTLALTTQASGSTANAAGLVPYYDGKEVIKTFVMVTDEEENTDAQLADGTSTRFFNLFMKYREEIYPAKLVFISFLRYQHAQGQMYTEFKNANVPDVIQFKFSGERPDLTKIDNLLGLLSTGSSDSFDDKLEKLQNEFQQNDVESIITKLLNKQEESAVPMEAEMAEATTN